MPFSHFKRKQDTFFEKIAVPFQKETGVFPIFGFSHYKRNKRLSGNSFPIFRTRHDTLPFSQKKEKNHSQSGFSDFPWSFPVYYDMCVFALCFRYNGNCDPQFWTHCFRLKWELTPTQQTSGLINGMSNIISHIFILKFHPLSSLVSIGAGFFEIASRSSDAQYPAAIGDHLSLRV